MVTGSGVEVVCPVVDMYVFHSRLTLGNCFRDKDMVL